MHTLIALLVAAAAACAIARPPGPTAAAALSQLPHNAQPPRSYVDDYVFPRMLGRDPALAYGYEDRPRAMLPAEPFQQGWLDKELERLNQMDDEDDDPLTEVELEFYRLMTESSYRPRGPLKAPLYPMPSAPGLDQVQRLESLVKLNMPKIETKPKDIQKEIVENKKTFAYTPFDERYFEPEEKIVVPKAGGHHEGGDIVFEQMEPRPIRQNPISRTKNLVADNLDRLKTGFTRQVPDSTDKPGPLRMLESPIDAADSIYGVALIAAVGAALTMTVFGFAFGWYTLSKKAKAAADVDYPAYGVTGPTIDTSGDRKLAHSAHMYHYQHQKQQIIAMERNGLEQRNGSISDPESEEENEEGDYTVYECPGFATTGDMEVKNPLFSEDPTPATPGKCELVKPQPKD